MHYQRTINRQPQVTLSEFLPRLLTAFLIGGCLFLFLLLVFILGYGWLYNGVIFPGVMVGGVDVAGMQVPEAVEVIQSKLVFANNGRILFQDEERIWTASPSDLGLTLDPENSALAAYSLGREGNPLHKVNIRIQSAISGVTFSPLMVYDERAAYAYLEKVSLEINRPTIEAKLSIDGLDVTVIPGQVGRTLDIDSTLITLRAQLESLTDGVIKLVISEKPPQILDASLQAETARKILSSPLVLQLPDPKEGDPGPWKLDRPDLAAMLAIQRVETTQGFQYEVGLRDENLLSTLESIAVKVNRTPANARFIFNDETHQLEVIQPARTGRSMDVNASLRLVKEKLTQGEHTVQLVVQTADPQISDNSTGEQLGITELVKSYTSYFYGSSTERIQNIQTAAARFHGVLVPPGAVFSMAEVLGDVTLDNGYAEALIIFGNRTIKGVGGGVCQVSTTLFRTAFFAGFPIVERYPHAYRVTYYEFTRAGNIDTDLAGLDATVFVPVVDFKFTNDTPYWLLMETYVNPTARTLSWKFYSTYDERTVEWETTGLQYLVEPEDPLVQENPELAKNQVKQIDWAVEGADVTISRWVYKNGQLYFEDQYSTHYLPWRAVYEYGPGTKPEKLNEIISQLSQ